MAKADLGGNVLPAPNAELGTRNPETWERRRPAGEFINVLAVRKDH